MADNFTQIINDSVWAFEEEDSDSVASLEFLNSPLNFRSFSEGITELICRCGYSEKNSKPEEKADFVLQKFKENGIKISKQTVKDWFLGVRRPDTSANSREKMYQLCFALNTSYEDVGWFFHHVYFGRCFNCHVPEEAVYLYCFKNNYDYQKAQKLISQLPKFDVYGDENGLYTNEIERSIENVTDDNELLQFFAENAASFGKWNLSAQRMINQLLKDIKGSEMDKKILDEMKKDIRSLGHVREEKEYRLKGYQLSQCGLITRELFECMQGEPELLLHKISDIDTTDFSYDFILNHIFDAKGTVKKNAPLPEIVRVNFPGRTSFQMVNSILTSNTYDSIRKFLIFLKFYHFWCNWKLQGLEAESPYDVFLDEINQLLYTCGYDDLYAGNPYDWLFMKASTTLDPLEFFRDAMGEILSS